MLKRCCALVILLIVRVIASSAKHSPPESEEENNAPQYFTVEGVVAPANYTRYELKFEHPMRIVLESVEGDADIYFSYNDKDVSFHLDKHDASSATCGLDYIDVASAPRPSYLAIYGHPSKNTSSSYRMLVIVSPDGTFEQPEVIHQWMELIERDREDGQDTHPIYIEILSGVLEIIAQVLL